MAISYAQVTVTSTATALSAAESGAVAGARLVLTNKHATDGVALGDASVATGTGFRLAAGATITVELTYGEQLYGIRSGANDIPVDVLRTGV